MATSGLIVPARKDVEFKDIVFLEAISHSKVLNITPDYSRIVDKINDSEF